MPARSLPSSTARRSASAAAPGEDVREVLKASGHRLRIESRGKRLAPTSNLRLQEGTATVVYVIGSADDGSIELMTEIVGGLFLGCPAAC